MGNSIEGRDIYINLKSFEGSAIGSNPMGYPDRDLIAADMNAHPGKRIKGVKVMSSTNGSSQGTTRR